MTGLYLAAMTGASLALVSSAHCAVMCGPVVMASAARRDGAGSRYFMGRLVSYTLLGALAGSTGRTLFALGSAKWVEAALSWALALTLLVSAGRTLSPRTETAPIALRKKPRVSLLSHALALSAQDPMLLGVVTALLPCGALFAALMAAAALGTPAFGALAMATFASLSGVALLGLSRLGRKLMLGPHGRRGLALGLLLGSALMVYRPIPMLRGETAVPNCHSPARRVE